MILNFSSSSNAQPNSPVGLKQAQVILKTKEKKKDLKKDSQLLKNGNRFHFSFRDVESITRAWLEMSFSFGA